MRLAGLDIGTTGCKLSVFEPTGVLLGSIYRDYPVQRSHTAHEIDAQAIWSAVQNLLLQASQVYPGIGAIGVTSFGESFVLLDSTDTPLLPIMLYTDPRGQEQCEQLSRCIGIDKILGITGLRPHSMYSLPKLMWIKESLPKVFSSTARVLLMEDYIVYMLTGTAQIDYSLASRTMAFDIDQLCWSQEILHAAGIDPNLFSPPVPIGTSAGPIRPSLASALGLDRQTIIVSISHDQVAAAIGSGVFDETHTVDGAGTVQCTTPVFHSCNKATMAENNYCIVPFIHPGSYVTYAYSYTGGALIKWFTDNLAGFACHEASNSGVSVHDLLQGSPDGCPTGILVLPHFAGAATPYMDSGSKGAIIGLTLSHTQQDLYRAMMEGVCYEMRLNQERLLSSGIELAPLYATGGGSKSRVWMQMKADILNLPVTALETSEAGATGCAMLAGIAAGVFASLKGAASIMVREKETFYPRKEAHEKHLMYYEKYKNLYEAVRPLV